MKNNLLIKSTLILSGAAVLSKILGSIFRIPLQNIAGDEVLGIFSLVYPVYMVALTLSVAGIPLAISILISKAQTDDNAEQIRDIFRTASVLALVFGMASFLLIYVFSSQIAFFLGGPDARLPLIIVSCTLLVAPYMAVYRGFFQGYGNMAPTAVSQVIEQFIRVSVILLAAFYLSVNLFDDREIAAGIMAGSFIGAAASFIYLRTVFVNSPYTIRGHAIFNFQRFLTTGKAILKLSIPICIGAVTMALLNLVDSLTIPLSLKSNGVLENSINYLYGIYGRGLALVQILTVLASSAVLPLIPLISSKLAQNDRSEANKIIGDSFFLISLFSLPAAIVLPMLANSINLALFTNTEGSLVLAIILAGSFFTSLTILGTGILQGIDKAKSGAAIIVGGAVLKVFLNIFLIGKYGLLGAAISTALIYLLLFLINTVFIWKHTGYNIFSWKIAKVVAASSIMGLILAILLFFIPFEDSSRIFAFFYAVIFVIAGTIIYLLLLFAFKVINRAIVKRISGLNKFNH